VITKDFLEQLLNSGTSLINDQSPRGKTTHSPSNSNEMTDHLSSLISGRGGSMVAGVGFLGVYAALQMAPFFRFVMIVAFAAALFAGYVVLKSKPNWKQFCHWLGSAAVAIFLFACVGSGGIPGLQWITNPWFGLGLLLTGIAANLAFAYVGGTATFASLHTILSIIALCLHPNEITLVTATFVTLASISFSYRYRWDLHLILTLTSFSHCRWSLRTIYRS